ncbi:unnamed protein product [Lymnaea stagnalis]|uniref:Uncharacterized protein n=1 Tax=Lymnaea stagnalis TaxID=6523 RepID=A0AAV2HU90_LYMST
MSVKDKRIKNVIESDDENELGACGTTNDIRRPSLAVPEPISGTGSLLEESVDNLSMEVHLGGDNSRHPSEISSVSYQNLLDDGEPTNSIISRRGSDDSLDSYQPDFPDAELPSDYMETFEACDLPLSEHFPMGALQGPENKEKSRGDRSSYLSDSSSNLSRPNVKLKEVSQELGENLVKLREKSTVEKIDDPEEGVTKRNSLEIRNNIPVVGEVKDYEKELNIDFSKVQGTKPKMIGLKQSPGLARRVDIEGQEEREHFDKAPEKQTESSLPPSSTLLTQKVRSKSMDNKTRENVIEVITPIPKNLNIENEYDYVKYARVQQGNSYVGMRLAYSSSNDSLNIKHSAGSDTSSREPSPEKSLHKKIHAEHESQEKVSEETLTEIPLNNSDYSEDKKAFTLSPENTECDSVEVESVTSEGDNSTPGFPTVEDGLSSSQASDAEEGACGHGSNSSPSKILKSKQKSAVQYDLPKEEEDCHPKEMDAQAIMDDLKMKREALDMAIADIKSAIQRSKSMSLESPYPSQQETEESQPVWIKRENKEAQNQLLRRQEEMRRVREEIERQQEQIPTAQGKPFQEKGSLVESEPAVMLTNYVLPESSSSQSNGTITEISASYSLPKSTTQPQDLKKQNIISSGIDTKTDFIQPLLGFNTSQIFGDESLNKDDLLEMHISDGLKASLAEGNPKMEGLKLASNIIENCDAQIIHHTLQFDSRVKENPIVCTSSNTGLQVENNIILNLGSTAMLTTFIGNNQQTTLEDSDLNENTVEHELQRKDLTVNLHQKLPNNGEDSLCVDILSYDHFESMSHVTCSQNTLNQNIEIAQVRISDTEECESDDGDGRHVYFDGEEPNRDGDIRLDGPIRGYDSDDECEDADGIRYTRRNKGKKYAPLQKDDSLEMGGAYGGSKREAALANNQVAHSGSNGSVANHVQGTQLLQEPGEHHVHRTEAPLSSEESSDIDANINSYSRPPNADSDTDEETDRLLQKQYQERDKHVEIPELSEPSATMRSEAERRHSKAKEAAIRDPDRPEVLIEGVLFRARYLGSTQLISEGQPSKAMRMMQAQEAVGRIKQNQGNSDDKTLGVLHFGERFQAPEGEHQPSTDVDLFVSTEKIMVLNTDLQEIMMDHSLRTISYIADIGDILVIMARRRLITSPDDVLGRRRRQAKILCHVFESDEAQLIAQSIGQAFQVAYLEFLKANGIEDPGLLKEMDYQDVLNQQEIYGEELNLFANKDFHKEVIVPKSKNEPLGVVIVESGWGSMVPTVVLANMLPTGPAARCGQLNIGDQIISINGISLVGLPLSACQTYIKASRTQTVVKLTVVPCPPVVEVLIKRPDVKYQLGFSVQNGVICSLLRGGIAERGGVRVGHRIIEINNQSVVAVPHEKIVTLLASSVGEIHMKTMPTSIFRLLTGQDVPHYL